MSSVSTHCPNSFYRNLPEILRTDRLFPVQILRVLRLLAKPLRRVRTVYQRPVVPPFHNANETGHSSVEQLNKPLIMPISTSLRGLEQVFFLFLFFCFCFFPSSIDKVLLGFGGPFIVSVRSLFSPLRPVRKVSLGPKIVNVGIAE